MAAIQNKNKVQYSDTQVKSAVLAVCLSFVLFGMILGMWFVHIPSVVARLNIDNVSLGFILLSQPLGGAVAQPILGRLAARFGERPLLFVAYIWAPIAVILPIMAWDIWVLVVGLFILGMSCATLNIGKSIQGSLVEIARGKASMSLFHAFFSVGILLATIVGSGLFALGLNDGMGAAMVSVMLIALGMWTYPKFLPTKAIARAKRAGKRFRLPNMAILALVMLAFLTNLTEGSANNWSALFLTDIKNASGSVAAAGLAMFSGSMAVARFAAGPIIDRIGEKPIVVSGGILIALGMLLVVFAPWALLSASGFMIIGVGAANIIPLAFSAAGRTPNVVHALAITSIANATMLGVFVGPPLIGLLGELFGLKVAMLMIGGLGVMIAIGGGRKKWR
ncbi:MAG: MFS transporter [Alphaproteobacteria bacterium]|nr:MFS transporter [Alphaproteobacteria bacterium]